MLFKELYLIHRMLKEKTSGLEYIRQWIKVLKRDSWGIFHMRNIDQKEWNRIKENIDSKMSRKDKDKKEYIKIDNIQKQNTKRLKEIVSKQGCITISEFGIISSYCAWLIAQHSDHDRKFQNKYLEILKENRDDVFLENINSLKRRLKI